MVTKDTVGKAVRIDRPIPTRRKLAVEDVAFFYGIRGDHDLVRWLSPFELGRYTAEGL